MNDDNQLKIKDKLKKIKELADRGYKGEAQAAKIKLETLLKKYNISIEEIEDDIVNLCSFKKPRDKYLRKILFQCYRKVCDLDGKVAYKEDADGKLIYFELTNMQFVELSSFYDWHKRKLNQELENQKETLYYAYIMKHRIYADTETTERDESKSDPEFSKKVFAAMNNLSNDKYCKQLEDK